MMRTEHNSYDVYNDTYDDQVTFEYSITTDTGSYERPPDTSVEIRKITVNGKDQSQLFFMLYNEGLFDMERVEEIIERMHNE